jgi:hypothetical protein
MSSSQIQPQNGSGDAPWKYEEMELLKNWMEKASGYRYVLSRSGRYYMARYWYIAIPTFIMSTLASGTSLNSLQVGDKPTVSKEMSVFMTSVTVLSTFLVALQNVLDYRSVAKEHLQLSVMFARYYREISVQLTSDRFRGDPSTTLKNAQENYNKYIEAASTLMIPNHIIDEYRAKFNGKVALIDIANGIDTIAIQNFERLSPEEQTKIQEREDKWSRQQKNIAMRAVNKFTKKRSPGANATPPTEMSDNTTDAMEQGNRQQPPSSSLSQPQTPPHQPYEEQTSDKLGLNNVVDESEVLMGGRQAFRHAVANLEMNATQDNTSVAGVFKMAPPQPPTTLSVFGEPLHVQPDTTVSGWGPTQSTALRPTPTQRSTTSRPITQSATLQPPSLATQRTPSQTPLSRNYDPPTHQRPPTARTITT